jgi:hypothetical protein
MHEPCRACKPEDVSHVIHVKSEDNPTRRLANQDKGAARKKRTRVKWLWVTGLGEIDKVSLEKSKYEASESVEDISLLLSVFLVILCLIHKLF